jgi:hypothetical protein
MQSSRFALDNQKSDNKKLHRFHNGTSIDLLDFEAYMHGANASLTKTDLIIKEIYVSELRFIKTLSCVLSDFFKPLSKIVQDVDCHIIFNNIAELKTLHETLVGKIVKNMSKNKNVVIAVCIAFDEYKENFMKNYAKYLCNQKAAILRLDQLILNFNHVKEVLDNCASHSYVGQFRLNDLIKLPFQRVLKYPLLFSELNKQIDDMDHSKATVIRTLLSMNELSIYLNEVQRDIDQIHDSLQFSQFSINIIEKILEFGKLMRLDTLRIRNNADSKKTTRQLALFTKALVISYPSHMSHTEDLLLMSQYEITSFSCGNMLFKSYKIKLSNRLFKEIGYDLFFQNKAQMNNWVKCLEQW